MDDEIDMVWLPCVRMPFFSQPNSRCRRCMAIVTAAAHFDNGRNMIAMVKGAKRYVLAPPNQCNKMHIVKNKHHPSRRHSLLNFANIEKDHSEEMREAASALAVETILKEVRMLTCGGMTKRYGALLYKQR